MGEPWTAELQERMNEAYNRCGHFFELLAAVELQVLASRMRTAVDADDAGAQLVRGKLRDASRELTSVVSLLGGAADLLALNGWSPDPSPAEPIPSSVRDHERDLAVGRALAGLRGAMAGTQEAYDYVEWRCAHLLAESPDLPGLDGLIEADPLLVAANLDETKEELDGLIEADPLLAAANLEDTKEEVQADGARQDASVVARQDAPVVGRQEVQTDAARQEVPVVVRQDVPGGAPQDVPIVVRQDMPGVVN